MRGWLISITSNTLVMPATAPADTRYAAQSCPMSASAYATGAFRNRVTSAGVDDGTPGNASARERYCVTGTMPVSTADTARYSGVQITSDAMMPIGRSRCGF